MYRKGKEDCNKGSGIYQYDFQLDKWLEIAKYPRSLQISSRACNYDKDTNMLTIYSSDDEADFVIHRVDLTKQKWFLNEKCNNLKDDGVSMYTLINNQLHIIGKSRHKIWDCNSQTIIQEIVIEGMLPNTGFHAIKYLKQKQRLMIFGGYSEDFNVCSNEIYSYSMKLEKWSRCPTGIPLKLHLMGIISTKDEKYIILFGGWGDEDHGAKDSKNIFVYNVDDDIIYQSKLELPIKGQYKAVMSDNYHESLKILNGYIREIDMNMIAIPVELLCMINCMVVTEYVHVIKDKKHWKIPLECILKSA